jgi:hypothetical protein
MAVEVKVVTKPGENILSALFLLTGNLALYGDMLMKGATPILTVGDLVTLVVNTAAEKETTVDFVQINGHGNKSGFNIGNDWIDSKTLPMFKSELSKITPHLSKNATVEVSACKAGNAKERMRDFSHILRGVAIIGYLVSQDGGLAPLGPPVIVTPGGFYSPPAPAAESSPPPPLPPSRGNEYTGNNLAPLLMLGTSAKRTGVLVGE